MVAGGVEISEKCSDLVVIWCFIPWLVCLWVSAPLLLTPDCSTGPWSDPWLLKWISAPKKIIKIQNPYLFESRSMCWLLFTPLGMEGGAEVFKFEISWFHMQRGLLTVFPKWNWWHLEEDSGKRVQWEINPRNQKDIYRIWISKNPRSVVQTPVLWGECQEVEEEGGWQSIPDHCSPRNNSLLIYFFTFFYFIFIHCKNIVNWRIAINNAMVLSGEQWRDSATHIHVPLLP